MNTVPDTGPSTSPSAAGSSSAMPAISASTPAPVMAEPKNTGCDQRLPGLRRELVAEPAVRDGRLVVDVRGEERIVVVGEQIGQLGRKDGVAPRRTA